MPCYFLNNRTYHVTYVCISRHQMCNYLLRILKLLKLRNTLIQASVRHITCVCIFQVQVRHQRTDGDAATKAMLLEVGQTQFMSIQQSLGQFASMFLFFIILSKLHLIYFSHYCFKYFIRNVGAHDTFYEIFYMNILRTH